MEKRIDQSANTIECRLELLKGGKTPVVGIKLFYSGKKTFNIRWDKNFGNILWDREFVLVNESNPLDMLNISMFDTKVNIDKENTMDLYKKTSNTYESRELIKLSLGDELNSTLDFSQLPISLESDFLLKENNSLRLYSVKAEKNGIKILIPVSNKLLID